MYSPMSARSKDLVLEPDGGVLQESVKQSFDESGADGMDNEEEEDGGMEDKEII